MSGEAAARLRALLVGDVRQVKACAAQHAVQRRAQRVRTRLVRVRVRVKVRVRVRVKVGVGVRVRS